MVGARCTHPNVLEVFRDAYVLEFLELPEQHTEADLHGGLLRQLKDFLIELGRDFCFVGSEYPLQVGGAVFPSWAELLGGGGIKGRTF